MDDKLTADIKAVKNKDFFKCPECQCTWFEQRRFMRIAEAHMVPYGANVPAKSYEFVLLVCGKCGKMTEPRRPGERESPVIENQYDEFYKELNE